MGANLSFGLAAAGAGANGIMAGQKQADEHNQLMHLMAMQNAREGREASAFIPQQEALRLANEGQAKRNQFESDSYGSRLKASQNAAEMSDPNRVNNPADIDLLKPYLPKLQTSNTVAGTKEALAAQGRVDQTKAINERAKLRSGKGSGKQPMSPAQRLEAMIKIQKDKAERAQAALDRHNELLSRPKKENDKDADVGDLKKIKRDLEAKAFAENYAFDKLVEEWKAAMDNDLADQYHGGGSQATDGSGSSSSAHSDELPEWIPQGGSN